MMGHQREIKGDTPPLSLSEASRGDDNSVCDVCCKVFWRGETQATYHLLSSSLSPSLPQAVINKGENSRRGAKSPATAVTFEDHLLIYFISTKMLKMSPDQFLELTKVSTQSSSCPDIVLCGDCQEVVNRAWRLFKELKQLQEKIEELGQVLLREGVHVYPSRNGDVNSGSIFRGILNVVHSQVATAATVVKVEAEEKLILDVPFNELNEDNNWSYPATPINGDEAEENSNVNTNQVEPETDLSGGESQVEDQEWLPGDKKGCKKKEVVLKTPVTNISSGQSCYACELCGSVYRSLLTFQRHMQAHEESRQRFQGRFDCQKCLFPSLSEHSLRYHTTKVHRLSLNKPSSSKYKTSSSKMRIRPRSKWLKNLKDGMFQCDICNARYTHPETIKKHMNVHDTSRAEFGGEWDCKLCRFPNLSEVDRKKHFKYKHNGSGNPKLEVASQAGVVQGHTDSRHPAPFAKIQEKSDDAKDENVATSNNSKLFSSAVPSQKEERYPCQLCDSLYKSQLGYERHMQVHEESGKLFGNKFDCPKCRFPTLSEYNLRYHTTKVHGLYQENRPSKDKGGSKLEKVRIRPRSKWLKNLKDGMFQCDICSARYTHPETIKKHMNEHDRSKTAFGGKWDCKLCRFPTLSETGLNKHFKFKHGKSKTKSKVTPEAIKVERGDVDENRSLESKEELVLENELEAADVGEMGDADDGDPGTSNRSRSSSSKVPGQSDGPFSCQLCASVYQRQQGYQRHLQAHQESRDILGNKFDCPKCRFPALSEYKLRYHMTKAHSLTLEGTPNLTSEQKRVRIRPNSKWLKHLENDKFQCHICQSKYFHPETLKKHMNAHNKSKTEFGGKWACKICRYPTLSAMGLRKHLTSNHGKDQENPVDEDQDEVGEKDFSCSADDAKDDHEWRPEEEENDDEDNINTLAADGDFQAGYPCSLCKSVYRRLRNFRKHMQAHEESKERLGNRFDCPHCKFPALSENKLRFHIAKVHKMTLQGTPFRKYRVRKPGKWLKNFKNGMYQCHLCKARYSHPETLKRHLTDHEKSKEDLGGKWECDKCGYPAMTQDALQKHLTVKHGAQHMKCDQCQLSFPNMDRFTSHMRSHREKEKYLNPTTNMYACKHCDFQTKTLSGLRGHRKVHEESGLIDLDDKPHLCSLCGHSFSTAVLLKTHIRHKHEGRYRFNCEHCGKGCPSRERLEEHLRTHEKNRVISRDFVCDLCGARYQTKRTLVGHWKSIHANGGNNQAGTTPRKEHTCKWCGMVFQHKQFLTRHLPDAHAELYKFNCDLCTKRYISSSSLRLHQQISHQATTPTFGDQLRSCCEYCGKGFVHRHNVICHYKCCPVKRKISVKADVS